MRKVMVVAALGVTACVPSEKVYYVSRPVETPSPVIPPSIRTGGTRLMSVETLYAYCDYDRMRLQVSATASTGGWSRPWLNRMSVDGAMVTYEVVAERPPATAAVSQSLVTSTVLYDELLLPGVSRVRVISQTNELVANLEAGCGVDVLP